MAAGDARIGFRAPVSAREVPTTLSGYDLLAVPSQWLETGPMVLLEAFAAGVPILGSDLGGIAELVSEGVDGLLVPPRSVSAWAVALEKLSREPKILATLRAGTRAPRTMQEVANDTAKLYGALLPTGRAASLHALNALC
jgi:glycosyltransferase involved in cell wall biosynthesis